VGAALFVLERQNQRIPLAKVNLTCKSSSNSNTFGIRSPVVLKDKDNAWRVPFCMNS
jgi:hypothetical protein